MKKIDIGQSLSILANAGVIAGIVFLGIEIRQNNELLAAESRAARNARVLEQPAAVSTDVDLAEVLVRAKNGEALSEAEEVRVISFNVWRLRGQEAFFNEYQAGSVPSIPLDQWRELFYTELYGGPSPSEVWPRARLYLSEDFVEFFEENVVNH